MKKKNAMIIAIIAIIMVMGGVFIKGLFVKNTPNDVINDFYEDCIITISGVDFESTLEKDEAIVSYDGTVEYKKNSIVAETGMCYAVVKIDAKLENSFDGAFSISECELVCGEKRYKKEKSGFLTDFGYKEFPEDEIKKTGEGYICFIIPEGMINEDYDKWYIECNGYKLTYEAQEDNEIPIEESLIEAQSTVEKEILEEYNKKESKDLCNALVKVNIYGNSPLTAVVLFETQDVSTVSVWIHGKSEDSDIRYEINDNTTSHQIPIVGLYADYKNIVTIAVGDESCDYIIETGKLPESISTYSVEKYSESKIESNGLIFMIGANSNRHAIDCNGDIRWYSIYEECPGTIEDTSGEGLYWGLIDGNSSGSSIINIDFLGKIYKEYAFWGNAPNHDCTLTDDNKLLYFTNDSIYSLDTLSGEKSLWLAFDSIIDKSKGEIDFRGQGVDIIHANTIEFNDGKLYLSLRNQCMLLKLDYKTKNIEWIATPGYKNVDGINELIQTELTKYAVFPTGEAFEWFYSQHDISILPDLDGDENTDDFTVFDNGVYRGNPQSTEQDMYSRIVHYRVDNREKTIEQIFDYGREMPYLHSSAMGGVQFLDNSYLGCFSYALSSDGEHHYTEMVEVDKSGKVQALFRSSVESVSYRGYFYRIDTFVPSVQLAEIQGKEILGDIDWQEYLGELPNGEGFEFGIEELSVSKSGRLRFVGWGSVNKKTADCMYFVLSDHTGKVKVVNLNPGYVGCIIPDGIVNEEEPKWGYKSVGISMSQIPEGYYQVGLLALAEGVYKYSDIGYTYSSGVDYQVVERNCLVDKQNDIDELLRNKFENGAYTIDDPLIVVNPYGNAPLSAYIFFNTEEESNISLTVCGKTKKEDVSCDFEEYSTSHIIPVYGLYPDENTKVKLIVRYHDGKVSKKTYQIRGQSLPSQMQVIDIVKNKKSEMEDGWTFISPAKAQDYVYAIDSNGDVRWCLSEQDFGWATGITQTRNGHLLLSGKGFFGSYYKYSIVEIDLSGKIYNEYPAYGMHHEVIEENSGDLLALTNNLSSKTVEDTVFEISRETGKVLRVWDLNQYFDVDNRDESGNHISDVNYGGDARDWLHCNSIEYCESDNSMIISARQQDAVFKIDLGSGELKWILSDPNDNWSDEMRAKLLKPTGEEFEWQYGQHCVKMTPEGTIIMFDNGDYRSKAVDDIIPATNGYSRLVEYAIDEDNMTVEQVYSWGENLGSDDLAAYVGSVQWLGNKHYLIHFGGIVKDVNGEATYSILEGIKGGTSASRIYEVKDGKIVFEAEQTGEGVSGNTFRSIRINPYSMNCESKLIPGNQKGLVIWNSFCEQTELPTLPTSTELLKNISVNDNGIYLNINARINSADMQDALIYFVGQETYIKSFSEIGSGNLNLNILDGEIPVGIYTIYVSDGKVMQNIGVLWKNETSFEDTEYRLELLEM